MGWHYPHFIGNIVCEHCKSRFSVNLVYVYMGVCVYIYIYGCPKCPLSFFCKINNTFFIFTNNFIDLGILSMSPVSHYWLLVGRGQGVAKHLPMPKTAPIAKNKMSILLRNFTKHFWDFQSVTTPSPYTEHIFSFVFQLHFYLLEIIKHNMLKMLYIFCHLSILKWLHKNPLILICFF